MRLYHSTTEENAAKIIRVGFKDSAGLPVDGYEHAVWFCPVPSAYGDTTLYIDVPDGVAVEVERCDSKCMEDIQREFLLPAAVANQYPIHLLETVVE